jgi:hypothetical protein
MLATVCPSRRTHAQSPAVSLLAAIAVGLVDDLTQRCGSHKFFAPLLNVPAGIRPIQ